MESNFDVKGAPLVERLREQGIVKGLAATADDVVFRLTNGMNISDVRAALRGDPPGRPNPRLTPHADSFWFHIRPGYYNRDVIAVYPSFKLGWLSTYFFALEFLTGLFLMVFYTPSTLRAYDNMLNILSNVPLGQFMRDLHRLGAEAMVIVVALHMLRTYITASYKRPRQFTWATGVILLFLTLGLSYTGYLLPWDQLAYWAVTIGASMIEATPPPIVGQFANILVKGAPDLGQAGLLRFYLLHVIGFPVLLLAGLSIHYYKVVLYGHSLPPEKEKTGEDSAKRVSTDMREYFIPDILSSDMLMVGFFTLIMVIAVVFFYSAPLENNANPLSTPLHTVAPWYFLWIQGLLKLGDKTLMGVVLPLMVIFPLFVVMPYIDVGPVRRYGKRRFAISLSMLFMAVIAVLSWMGTPHFLVQTSKDQEIFFELAPDEKIGLVRSVPYEELNALIGTSMSVNQHDENYWQHIVPRSSKLWDVMETYEEEVFQARLLPADLGGLPNAEGFLVINQLQPDLVGVTLRITWDDVQHPGETLSSEKLVPVPKGAYPEGARGH